ncbi:MtrB/PioB family decaheme-associated outer membrane protein [Natronospira bacteriovora]|uniref:MtrB/PioB family decaheme-associated outer membrane protein n=1 Tax=Natronospira bacteriovora TaxID=3069753 RepID=A0ABU0W497_9GAMM|nr:MtrB/PioB family decaheme-associated outer membrane protein [Natronospira sp. AB-CW4]MDQ2068821.1 MtrB/PioB family decaheme-associated outer membrane protein [Natronospira sp. AB-CW4]
MSLSPRSGRYWLPVLLLALSWPLAAEQSSDGDTGWLLMDLDLGLGYQDGELTGLGRSDYLASEGWRGIGGLWLDWRSERTSDDPAHFLLDAESRGPTGRWLDMSYNRQGVHRTRLHYLGLPRRLGDGLTPYSGAGGYELRLPDDWDAAAGTSDMGGLDEPLMVAPYDHMRRELRLAHERTLDQRWQLGTDFRVERRDGTRPVAAVMGITGGNTRAALVPAPVDYETREAEITLRYQREGFHAETAYFLSRFDGGRNHMRFDSPWTDVGGWSPAAFHPDGRGHLGLPPDNQSQQLRFGLGQVLSSTLRLSADMAIGRTEQDEPFLAYTINPDLTVEEGLPRDSLEGRIDLLRIHGRLNWQPMPRLRVDLRYRHEDRDNRTPVDVFNYVGGDAANQTPGSAHGRARLNRPISFTEDRLDLDTAWRLAEGGQLSAGYQRQAIRRDYTDVGRTEEDRIRLGLRRPLGERQQWSLRLEQAWRRADDYDATADYFHSHTSEYIDTVDEALRFDNHPLMYRYNLADRDQQRVELRWDLFAADELQLGAGYQFSQEDYDNSPLGLERGHRQGFTADMGWQIGSAWALDAFASSDLMEADQSNRSFRGGGFLASEFQDPARNWRVENRDRYRSLGSGLNWQPQDAGYRIRLEWVESRSRSTFDLFSGPALTLEPLDPVRTRGRVITLSGEHELSERMALRWEWYRDHFSSDDWAWVDVAPDTIERVIGSGQSLGYETLDWVSLSLRWSFKP